MSGDELIGQADIQKIASEGAKLYEELKPQYDPGHHGKFLAIDISTKNSYLGDTSAEALQKARIAHPGTVFYLVKIGFDTAESVLQSLRPVYGARSF